LRRGVVCSFVYVSLLKKIFVFCFFLILDEIMKLRLFEVIRLDATNVNALKNIWFEADGDGAVGMDL